LRREVKKLRGNSAPELLFQIEIKMVRIIFAVLKSGAPYAPPIDTNKNTAPAKAL